MKIVTLPRHLVLHVERALELELEHADASVLRDPLDLGAERPVPAPGDVRHALEELAGVDPARELLVGEELVVAPVDLARPLRPRRGRDGDLEAGHALEQALDQRPLPRSGRPGDDEDRPRRQPCASRGG